VASHLNESKEEASACSALLKRFIDETDALLKLTCPFLVTVAKDGAHQAPKQEFDEALLVFRKDARAFETATIGLPSPRENDTTKALLSATDRFVTAAESSRDLAKQAEHVFKLLSRLLDVCEMELEAREHEDWNNRDINRARKTCEEARHLLVEQLRLVRYFHRQAVWLTERFPDAVLVDVPGLVKLVDRREIEKNEWSLTPGRYVGIAPEEVDEDFDFEETIKDIHIELQGLNDEAEELAATIAKNFKTRLGHGGGRGAAHTLRRAAGDWRCEGAGPRRR